MKKLLLATALAGSLIVSGCATTSTGGVTTGGGLTPAQIAQIQNAATVACAFLPTYQTVQDLIVAGAYPPGIPIAQLANSVGNAICAAVTVKSARPNQAPPTVNGVVIRGQFVSR